MLHRDRPDTILEHSLPDEKLICPHRDDAWDALSAGDAEFLTVQSTQIPYVIFENEDDVTTGKPALLAAPLEETLARLSRPHGMAGDGAHPLGGAQPEKCVSSSGR